MRRFAGILILVLVVAGVAGGGYWYMKNRTATAAAASSDGSYRQVVTVERGNLSSTLSVVGQLEAVQSATLSFDKMSATAELVSLEAETGNTVTAGQVLATIDAAPYQQALDQAKSDLQAAEQSLADLQTPPTALAIAQAGLAVARAEQAVEQAKADLAELSAPDLTSLERAVQEAKDTLALFQLQSSLADRDSLAKSERDLSYTVAWYERHISDLQQLVAQGKANKEQTEQIASDQESLAEARAELARVQAERALARKVAAAELAQDKATLAEAQEALAEAKAWGAAAELDAAQKLAQAQAEYAVSEAEVALKAAQEARAELEEGPDATALATAQANADKKRLAVSEAEAALAGCALVAPFDGTILEVQVSQGETVAANTTILTLANLKSLQVVASVDETTIRQVSAGQAAQISFDAYPGQAFTGAVLSVPLEGELQGGVTVYDVPLSLGGAEALNLLVGMTANVEISVGEAADALLVPTLALTRVQGQYQVSVPNTSDPAGEPETVPVQVGLSDGTYTQIVKGLNEGDQIIVTLESTESNTFFRNESGGGIFSNLFRFGRR